MFETLIFTRNDDCYTVKINRSEHKNSINCTFLKELNSAMDMAAEDETCRVFVITGCDRYFCTGMDLDVVSDGDDEVDMDSTQMYSNILKKMALFPKPIITVVNGAVMAGGVGIVAASDIAIGSSNITFTLSEAIWGLLPSMVMPYLIRRIGYQNAYRMTLTARSVDAETAYSYGLIDELTDNVEILLNKYITSFRRVSKETVYEMKKYFRKMWIIDDDMERTAIEETHKLINSPNVRQNISNFVKYQKFPWEK